MHKFTSLIEGMSFTEGPRWRDGRLYYSDFHTHRVLAIDPERPGVAETVATLEGQRQPGGIGWLPDGRMLVASKHERQVLRLEADGSLALHADLHRLAPWHVNEMIVDHAGRAWVGNYGFDLDGGAAVAPTGVICVDPDGSARMASDALRFPNGTAITADGRTMIVAESFGNRLSAFDLDGGVFGPRRTWAEFGPYPPTTNTKEIFAKAEAVPDGICLDAEGAAWVADVAHSRVVRVAEDGHVLEEIGTEGLPAFAVMLGGADRRTLFVCVAPRFLEEECAANHRAAIWMTRVEVPGAGLP